MEIIVDTYSPEKQAMGWYAYLDDTIDFPLKRAVSPSGRNPPWRKAKRYAWLECPRQIRLSARCS